LNLNLLTGKKKKKKKGKKRGQINHKTYWVCSIWGLFRSPWASVQTGTAQTAIHNTVTIMCKWYNRLQCMKHTRTIQHQEDNSEVVPVHAMKTYVEREEKLHSFLTLAADGDNQLVVPTETVSPLCRAGAHSWSRHSCSCSESNYNPYIVQPVA
jgi:hypothetical protein